MAQPATEIPKAEAPDKQTYCRIKDGHLELRVKLQSGQTSRSGKSEVLVSTGKIYWVTIEEVREVDRMLPVPAEALEKLPLSTARRLEIVGFISDEGSRAAAPKAW